MRRTLLLAAWWLTAVGIAAVPGMSAAQPTGEIPPVFDDVGITERLGERVPLDLRFANENGEQVALSSFFDGKRPVMLNLVYHECPMLCSLLLTELTKTLQQMEWQPGGQYDIVTVSFSATEDDSVAARAKAKYIAQLGRPEAAAGWHFLTGTPESIQALAASVGFRFRWVESTREFAHPAALMFLGPDGTITRYIHGMGYEPEDVRKALVEASEGRIGTAMDQILLYCYKYDADANSYVLHAQNLMKLGGFVMLLLLGTLLTLFWRRERRTLNHAAAV